MILCRCTKQYCLFKGDFQWLNTSFFVEDVKCGDSFITVLKANDLYEAFNEAILMWDYLTESDKEKRDRFMLCAGDPENTDTWIPFYDVIAGRGVL